MENLVSHDDLLQECINLGISAHKLEKLRETDLFPRPISRKGKKSGQGVIWFYPSSSLEYLKQLNEELSHYPRSYDEVTWRLWFSGHHQLWNKVKGKLTDSYPDLEDLDKPIDINKYLEGSPKERIEGLSMSLRKRLSKFNPFRVSDEILLFCVQYFMYPFIDPLNTLLWDNPEDLEKPDAEKALGKQAISHKQVRQKSHSYDPYKWKEALSQCDEQTAKELAEIFKVLEEDLKKPEHKKLNRVLHSRLGKTLVLWKIRAVLTGILAMMLITSEKRRKHN